MMRKVSFTLVFCLVLGLVWFYTGQAQDEPKYLGSEVCSTCHADTAKTWQHSVHRRTLFNKDPEKNGCEGCHGPGGAHVAGGGDKSKIIRPKQLSSEQLAVICQKCHTQEEVTLWPTSQHARAKLNCTNCHDVHSAGEKSLLADVENGKSAVEGIARALKQAELAANTAAAGSPEKEAANEKVKQLKAEKEKIQNELKGAEAIYRRTAEPYVCYNCHKDKEVQAKMPSHHPVEEGKATCSGCHNPHGGPSGLLRGESVTETCFKCHADKLGPFTFEHPPVTEDCTICHNPHGSVQNNLLAQSMPFLCMKCHAAPHSRSSNMSNTGTFPNYFNECTDCHTQVHGSDEHGALHF
jgi:predicted CXXCH cytochrome family protein